MKTIPIGNDDFKKIREENQYYADKSELISDILADGSKVFLITRPRLFGKPLNLSMIDAFFNMEYKGNTWFDGLKISEHAETSGHRNAYPVVNLDMKDIPVDSYSSFLDGMYNKISLMFGEFNLENLSDSVSSVNIDLYRRGVERKLNKTELKTSVPVLCRILMDIHGVSPIVLIDEYDKPVNDAFDGNDYDKILGFLREFYSSALKSNDSLSFAVVTGVMQIAKESVFSEPDNLCVSNIFTGKFDERYGFTETEVKDLCAYYGHPEKSDEAKEWYGDYRFGNAEIYNPWSILNYVYSGFEPGLYWGRTGGNDIIGTLTSHSDYDTHRKLMCLGEGVPVKNILQSTMTMCDPSSDTSSIYYIMAVTGYLNAVPSERKHTLSIPNLEMRAVFSESILSGMGGPETVGAFGSFLDGIETMDTEAMSEGLNEIIANNLPFFILSEKKDYDFVHIAVAMSRLGRYETSSEYEWKNDRAVMIMKSTHSGTPNIVFEVRKSGSKDTESLKKCADEALCQTDDMHYLRGMTGRALRYGISFHGKEFAISAEETAL